MIQIPPIPGSVRVAGFIAPTDSTDVYAVTDDIYGKGGFRPVADAIIRTAITPERRKEGMFVYQIDTGELWTLFGGITNSNWVLVPIGGGKYTETFFAPNEQVGLGVSGGELPPTGDGYYVKGRLKFTRMTFWAKLIYIAGSPNLITIQLWNGDFSKKIFQILDSGPFSLPSSETGTTEVPIDTDTLEEGETFWITFNCTPSSPSNKITANWGFQLQGIYV